MFAAFRLAMLSRFVTIPPPYRAYSPSWQARQPVERDPRGGWRRSSGTWITRSQSSFARRWAREYSRRSVDIVSLTAIKSRFSTTLFSRRYILFDVVEVTHLLLIPSPAPAPSRIFLSLCNVRWFTIHYSFLMKHMQWLSRQCTMQGTKSYLVNVVSCAPSIKIPTYGEPQDHNEQTGYTAGTYTGKL